MDESSEFEEEITMVEDSNFFDGPQRSQTMPNISTMVFVDVPATVFESELSESPKNGNSDKSESSKSATLDKIECPTNGNSEMSESQKSENPEKSECPKYGISEFENHKSQPLRVFKKNSDTLRTAVTARSKSNSILHLAEGSVGIGS